MMSDYIIGDCVSINTGKRRRPMQGKITGFCGAREVQVRSFLTDQIATVERESVTHRLWEKQNLAPKPILNRDDPDTVQCIDIKDAGIPFEEPCFHLHDIPVGSIVMVQDGYKMNTHHAKVLSHKTTTNSLEIQWLARGDCTIISIHRVREKFTEEKTRRTRRRPRRLVETKEDQNTKRYCAVSRQETDVVPAIVTPALKTPAIHLPSLIVSEKGQPKRVQRIHTSLRSSPSIIDIIHNIDFVVQTHDPPAGSLSGESASLACTQDDSSDTSRILYNDFNEFLETGAIATFQEDLSL